MTFSLFRLLTWPYLKRHAWGQILPLLGIALATGVYASMHLANRAITDSFRAVEEALAGSAQLQVSGGEAGVPEAALDQIRRADCVDAAAALMLRNVAVGIPGEGGLAILGVDLLEEPRFREYKLQPGTAAGPDDAVVFFAHPNSVLITEEFAHRAHLAADSPLPVWTGREEVALRVGGILENQGLARAYGGAIAVMDLYGAQHVFGRRGYFDRIDVAVRKGRGVAECRETLTRSIGGQLRIGSAASRGRAAEDVSSTYSFLVQASGLLGILVAMALVRHAGLTAVARREREIGVVLGLGAEAGAVRRMVLVESTAMGVLGGVAGVAIGVLGAPYLRSAFAHLLELTMGVHIVHQTAHADLWWAVATAAAAALCCTISGFGPAKTAATIAPIQLMEARTYGPLPEPHAAAMALAAGTCGAAALIWQAWYRRPAALYVALPLVALALALTGRALANFAMRVLRPLFAFMWPVEGPLAIDSLGRTSRRTRGTIMGLGAAVATFVAISGLSAAYAESFRRWTRQIANADFLIHSSSNPAARGLMFPASMLERLRRLPGVAAVTPLRRIAADVEGRPAKVIGIDFAVWKTYGGAEIPASPGGAAISRNLANVTGKWVGSRIGIAGPDRRFDLPVIAVIDDFTDENGTVWVDWRVFQREFAEDGVEMFALRLAPDADRASMRQALRAAFDPRAPVLIMDGREFRGYLDSLVDQWRGLAYIQVCAAMTIALMGIASFMVVSLVERRRELGLIVMLGATPGQLVRCVLVEALGVAAAGLLLGAPLGVLLETYLLFTLRESVSGFQLPWRVDAPLVLALFLVVPAAAMAAGLLPLRTLHSPNLVREVEADA